MNVPIWRPGPPYVGCLGGGGLGTPHGARVPITVTHRTQDPSSSSSLRSQRGAKLADHLCSILAFCGATVNRRDKQNQTTKGTSKDSVTANSEQCDLQAVEASVGNKRQSDEGHVDCIGGSEVREKKAHVESRSHTREDESVNAAPHTTEAKMHVVCTPQTMNAPGTQRQCVSEGAEVLVTGEGVAAQESPHSQEEQVVFVVTSSMKGVKDGPWVYQYGGVVEVRTGGTWAGSVQEYCRLLVEELKRTSEMRQRDVDGPEWVAFLEEQAERCLMLQLLSPTHSNPLRVEVEGDTHNTKEASFMLYNYARLCSILDHFEQCVQQGDVAPLPPIEDVDFSLLRNDRSSKYSSNSSSRLFSSGSLAGPFHMSSGDVAVCASPPPELLSAASSVSSASSLSFLFFFLDSFLSVSSLYLRRLALEKFISHVLSPSCSLHLFSPHVNCPLPDITSFSILHRMPTCNRHSTLHSVSKRYHLLSPPQHANLI
ncbi:DALR anticodon-binding domain-containing protein 3 [Portunus trituberculatus]|uniref:DALR anticodon-binding domain-containing protein 3 n=1 Tax=Portunus trituberculatus TaxID=210409 RepID=A0A5B7DLS1_PORTR|nr:DALR anticodon-binding domain-containing protein 3 [Portunus trituberculatus]